MATNVPAIAFTLSGPVLPPESAVLAGREADLDAAFGGNLNLSTISTPQGQLATSDSAIIGAKNDEILFLTNMFDPASSLGRWQDGLAKIYFITRMPAEPTAPTVNCVGLPGVVIPVGALLQAQDGNQYSCTGAGTIPSSGTIALTFQCAAPGPIACPAQQFTIVSTVGGWDTAISSSAAVLGTFQESQADFEYRRGLSVAMNGQGSAASVLGAVLAVGNVLDAYVYDNTSQSPVTVGGVTIPGNCLYVCAAGGLASAIAQAIWTKKSPGCATTGGATITVYDLNYSAPQPSYQISYTVATAVAFYMTVSIANGASIPANALAQIQAVVLNAFVGADGGPRARIGSTVFASRFYPGIRALGAWAQVIRIVIGESPGDITHDDLTLNINQIPSLTAANIGLTLI